MFRGKGKMGSHHSPQESTGLGGRGPEGPDLRTQCSSKSGFRESSRFCTVPWPGANCPCKVELVTPWPQPTPSPPLPNHFLSHQEWPRSPLPGYSIGLARLRTGGADLDIGGCPHAAHTASPAAGQGCGYGAGGTAGDTAGVPGARLAIPVV